VIVLPSFNVPLQRVRGVVNDAERIFELMRDLGGETAGGLVIDPGVRRIRGLRFGAALAFDEHLHAVQHAGHEHEREMRRKKRLGRIVARPLSSACWHHLIEHAVFPARRNDIEQAREQIAREMNRLRTICRTVSDC